MDIKAIQLKRFIEQTDSLYKNIIITSARARQIVSDRYQEFAVEEDIEDSDQLDALLESVDPDVAKPISQSTEEFINGELDWREPSDEIEQQEDLDEK